MLFRSQQGCGDKIGFITCENMKSMVAQTFELKRTGDSITAVNLLKLLAVICAPGTYRHHAYIHCVVTNL